LLINFLLYLWLKLTLFYYNTMETINDLLRALDNKVPASIAKRLDGLNKLNDKLELARVENSENPTEESQEKLDEIIEFITDTQDDLREDLSELVAKKREADAKARQVAKNRAEAEAKKSAEAEALKVNEKEELEQKELLENEVLEAKPITDTEKKSGIGWGGLVIGGALLILSAGAINYFGKRR
jgi:hypothetical protein